MLASWVRHGRDLKIITPNREVCQMDAWTGPPSIPFPSLPFGTDGGSLSIQTNDEADGRGKAIITHQSGGFAGWLKK